MFLLCEQLLDRYPLFSEGICEDAGATIIDLQAIFTSEPAHDDGLGMLKLLERSLIQAFSPRQCVAPLGPSG